jgi:hypothetical protein
LLFVCFGQVLDSRKDLDGFKLESLDYMGVEDDDVNMIDDDNSG